MATSIKYSKPMLRCPNCNKWIRYVANAEIAGVCHDCGVAAVLDERPYTPMKPNERCQDWCQPEDKRRCERIDDTCLYFEMDMENWDDFKYEWARQNNQLD